ncbi:hypothetical protein [Tsukamurella pseudospumae]|uniref:4Fe-4S Wbl-type domain-containing protein n=3 Tax=Tsukamurella pseudospumae TaxID=239498 RepID=A0A138AK72_9ACTN|nr:hypothetical protein [Tsukamurella pseudospumae]KXO98149.1 hypothetical protein AXK60_25265 [Tsukamurella pseudospumae]KXP10737.1 hypothetical protein AXK60_24945 [Tsukamurella pseudospumae]
MEFSATVSPPCEPVPQWFDLTTATSETAAEALRMCAGCPFLDACDRLRLELKRDGNLAFAIYAGHMHAKGGVEVPASEIHRVDSFGHRGRVVRRNSAAA